MRRLASCYFGSGDGKKWPRMAAVLRHCAEQHCAGWHVDIRGIEPEPLHSAIGMDSHVSNTQKMDYWASVVESCDDGDELLLIDADTMILRSLDDVWAHPFDMAYTTKSSRFPFNSGVVFLRVSDRVRDFAREWQRQNRRMLDDRVHHQTWRRRYGGINQAALGYVLETKVAADLLLLGLPCREWNCEDSSWATFDQTTRVVHIKSALRRAVFDAGGPEPRFQALVDIWRGLELSCTAAGVSK
jgi:hypothetical protein